MTYSSKVSFWLLVLLVISSCSSPTYKTFTKDEVNIVPKPNKILLGKESFSFNQSTKFVIESTLQEAAAIELSQRFKLAANWDIEVAVQNDKPSGNFIQFVSKPKLPQDAYELSVEKSKVSIYASGFGGFLYGVETIRQLLPVEIESNSVQEGVEWIIPTINIEDAPRFSWRGLMVDVSRHFFPKEDIKKVIDGLALHKMNVFHWHLVDDQGWRIEIKKYPKLTEFGAWRVDHEDKHWGARPRAEHTEKGTYGGYYTQEDIKEIVAYAKSKNIQVVPEIEMPAHVSSAVAAYPELSCYGKEISVPSGGLWPITDIYCAGRENTFEFLENVLSEVMELFPSTYIHIGGDEATKTNWKTCEHCQARMKSEGLASEEELQSYFIKRMEQFISSKGRVLIGWDEILEGGLAPGATVMSWRGVKGGLEETEEGHDVVMTPNSHCYFDHYQGPQDDEPLAWGGYLPLSKVYTFDPIVESMTAEQAKHVLGGQANLWTEYMSTSAQLEYMIYPRVAALSEAVWSTKDNRRWDDFANRVESLLDRYSQMDINYAKSAYLISADADMDIVDMTVGITLENELPKSDIRYSINGGELTKYIEPVQLKETTNIQAVLFKNDEPIGKEFNKTINFHKAVGKKIKYKTPFHKSYQGAGEYGMVNTIRGTKNFHDGQWQAWLGEDMEATIDFGSTNKVSTVSVGVLESQGPGIYHPTGIEVYTSTDGNSFEKIAEVKRAYKPSGIPELKDFILTFEEQQATHVRVKVVSLKKHPLNGGTVWLFVDEILVE